MATRTYKVTLEEDTNELEMDAIDMQREIEKQLHEQYANNTNTNLGTTLSLIGVLLAVFGFYGKVYLECGEKKAYNYDDLVFITQACFFVLTLIAIVCMQMGASLRSDQFVIYNIRKKYYNRGQQYNEVFPSGYDPIGKGFFNFLPGLFGVIAKACFVAYLLLLFAARFKLPAFINLSGVKEVVCLNIIMYMVAYMMNFLKYKKKNMENKDNSSENDKSIWKQIINFFEYIVECVYYLLLLGVILYLGYLLFSQKNAEDNNTPSQGAEISYIDTIKVAPIKVDTIVVRVENAGSLR